MLAGVSSGAYDQAEPTMTPSGSEAIEVSAAVGPAAISDHPVRHPWVWFVLYFPFGLSFGFPSIALGYLAVRAGVSVGAIAGVVGMTLLASGWKFVWAPVGDYTLTRKGWYLLATTLVVIGCIAMTAVPLSGSTMPLLSGLVL